jgi:hypothetical protein
MNAQASAGLAGVAPGGAVPVENASTMNSYQERYEQVSQLIHKIGSRQYGHYGDQSLIGFTA